MQRYGVVWVALVTLLLGCANPGLTTEVVGGVPDARSVTTIVLRNGSSGVEVRALQWLLRSRGHSLNVDGSFGSITESNVRTFQTASGLVSDGIVGTNTWNRLIVTVRQGSTGDAVRAVQELLRTKFGHAITVDGNFGPNTHNSVTSFQRSQGLTVDGVVGPQTWTRLLGVTAAAPAPAPAPANFWATRGHWRFPLEIEPTRDPRTGGRYFGASRDSGTRVHAGIDLTAPPGTRVFAMEAGRVIAYYYFFSGTNAMEVQHADGTVARYCEIHRLPGVAVGQTVSRGQVIGTVGRLASGNSMLHLEVFQGTASGGLTNRNNTVYDFVPNRNWQRRRDLQNPMGALNLPRR